MQFPRNLLPLRNNHMQSTMKSILGIGNAITDIPVFLPDRFLLNELGLQPGSMNHIDGQKERQIWDALQGVDLHPVQGGSAANTVAVASRLGMKCGFIGKVGKDALGNGFKKELEQDGVCGCLFEGELPSGRAYTFIDQKTTGMPENGGMAEERTFAAYLGAALEFLPGELAEEMFQGYDCLHIEGYLMQCAGVVERVVEIARGRGMVVSFDLGSVGIVKNFRSRVERIVADFADIVFANEDEALAFTGKRGEEAAMVMNSMMQDGIAVVKQGEKGSVVLKGRELYRVAAVAAEAVDTTGAGDAYAAGFLYAYSQGADAGKCGEAGSLLASKVVAVIGPKIGKSGLEAGKTAIEALLK